MEKGLMKRVYLPLAFIMFISAVVVFIYGYINLQKTKKQIYKQVNSTLKTLYEIKMEEKKDVGLTNALSISNDSAIKKALQTGNREIALEELKNLSQTFKKYTKFKNIKIHIHTADVHSFLRSWKVNKFGDDLSSFRKTIVWVKEHKKPLVSIEIGRLGLGLRAIAPIISNDKYLGSVEFIQGLNSIERDLIKKNTFFIVVLKKEYLNIATFLKNSKTVAKKYILAVKDYDKKFYQELKNIKDITPIIQTQTFYALSIPIKDFSGKVVAYAIIGKEKKDLIDIVCQRKKEILFNLFIMFVSSIAVMIFVVYVVNEFAVKPIAEAKQRIEEAYKTINKSIEYASIIQQAILPRKELKYLRSFFRDYFIIWQPRDTVGGDIYFIEKISEDEILIMVVDCTGHGVPGAFVTMLVKAIENQMMSEISQKLLTPSPSEVLNYFNRQLNSVSNDENFEKLGFDGGVLYYNKKEKIIKYAGAKTPLFVCKDGIVEIIKGDKCSVGYKNECDNYKEHTLEAIDNMQIYLTTDGFIDQNGGEKSFPFGKKRFKKLIEKYCHLPMKEQKEKFLEEFNKWKTSNQTDDITIIGVKI